MVAFNLEGHSANETLSNVLSGPQWDQLSPDGSRIETRSAVDHGFDLPIEVTERPLELVGIPRFDRQVDQEPLKDTLCPGEDLLKLRVFGIDAVPCGLGAAPTGGPNGDHGIGRRPEKWGDRGQSQDGRRIHLDARMAVAPGDEERSALEKGEAVLLPPGPEPPVLRLDHLRLGR